MSYDPDNVLALALAYGELDKFLAGEPFYFLETKDANDEPQNVVIAIKLLILPYWRTVADLDFPERFACALVKMLNDYPDRNKAIYMAENWLWGYRYCLRQKILKPDGVFAGLFEYDMSLVAAVLKQHLEANKSALVADTRWAGQPWNSDKGLWEPLMRSAIDVRDALGGPDYVPANR